MRTKKAKQHAISTTPSEHQKARADGDGPACSKRAILVYKTKNGLDDERGGEQRDRLEAGRSEWG
eukprot:4508885-Pyramimonas_sp.AAC.1